MRLIDADALLEELWRIRWNLQMMDDTQTADKMMAGLRKAEEKIEAAPTIDLMRWTPVSERLPKEGVQVLVTDDAGGLATIDVDCGYFDKEYGRFEWFHSQNVTAWMPLPEPYKEVE